MENEELTKFREMLPHRYASIISKKLVNISAPQVTGVFNGLITNPDIMEPVLAEAKKLLKRIKDMKSGVKEIISEGH